MDRRSLSSLPNSLRLSSDDVPKTLIRSVSKWRPNPRHPGPNFTGFRVQMNCIEPPDQRTRRPSVNWFPLRTMTYNSSANLCSREAVTGTRANLQEVQIVATMSLAAQARYSCGFRLDLQARVRWTLRLAERPPLSCKIYWCWHSGKNKNIHVSTKFLNPQE